MSRMRWTILRTNHVFTPAPRNSATCGKRFVTTKPYYVTTPIFYVNAAPHVGHLYTLVLADILKRWQVLNGKTAILCTGTDEHGMKIQRAADAANADPKEFCDQQSENFKKLAKSANISNDHFIRTTDADHKEAAQHFWRILNEKGFIYEKKHEGYYCVSDETFYPLNALEKKVRPFDGKIILASKESGKEVEWMSEINYHFRMSAFQKPLLELYKANPDFIVPAQRMQAIVQQVEAGLEDLSISRPSERLNWGIPVPDDARHTIYVWFEALINYVTKAGYPWALGKESAGGWPADVQVIGKDIIRFHCIYWPALLMALGIPSPKQVLTHAHWTMNRKKMSKSDGNGVDPYQAIDRFGIDTLRYYLAHNGGITNDADYGNVEIVTVYKKGLQGGLGNLVHRIASPRHKQWSVREAVKACHGKITPNLHESSVELREAIDGLRMKASQGFEELNVGKALHEIMDVVYKCNKYVADTEPWKLAKSDSPSDQALLSCVIYHAAEALRVTGILLQPFMPTKSRELLDRIGVESSRRTFADAVFGSDGNYGTLIDRTQMITNGNGKFRAFVTLFPPLELEE